MSIMLTGLDSSLDSVAPSDVLSAAWESLDLAGQVADAMTWEEGADELQALAAAQACDAARSVLPLPPAGRAVTPESTTPVDPWIALLRHTAVALERLAAHPDVSEESRPVLNGAAGQAVLAAEALASIRER